MTGMNPMMMQANPAMAPTGGVRPPLVQGNATQAGMRPINPAMMGMTPAVSSLFLNFLDDEHNDDESDGDEIENLCSLNYIIND